MKTYGIVIIALAIVLLISVVCVWFVPSFQDFMAGNTMWNGVRTFLREYDTTELFSLSSLPEDPKGAALITIPYLDYNQDDLQSLKTFLENGGTLLLTDDFGFGNHVLDYLGIEVRFSGQPLLDPLFCFQNQWMPKITDYASPQNFQTVVLNHATALENTTDTDLLAWSSATSYLDINRSEVWNENQNEPKGPFPIAAKLNYGRGTLVLASDPSLMINSMINHADNSAFVNYLLGLGGDVKTTYFDTSHLSATPLDVTKTGIGKLRGVLGTPYPLLAIVSILFAVTAWWMVRTGGSLEQQPTNR